MVEALVAVCLAALFFVAFGQTLATAIQGARDNRLQQQATAIATAHIEYGRSLEWKDLALPWVWQHAPMVDAELNLTAAEAGLEEDEPLLFSWRGDVDNRVYEYEGETTFVVWRYVTDPGADLKRLVVLVKWDTGGTVRSFQTSTLIAEESTL
jgi:hypothetical protein